MATTYPRITGVSPTTAALDEDYVNVSGDTMIGALAITDTTSSTSVSTGSLTLDGGFGMDGDSFIGGKLDVAGHVAFGESASVDADTIVSIAGTVTPNGVGNAQFFDVTVNTSSGGAPNISVFEVQAHNETTSGVTGNPTIRGIRSYALQESSYAANALIGVESQYASLDTGTVPLAMGVYVKAPLNNSSADITAAYGLRIENLGDTYTDEAYGIHIVKQANATSYNYGLVMHGDYSSGGFSMGQVWDTEIYFDGTDLVIDSDINSTGTIKMASSNNWTGNGSNAVTITNVAPAGVGTATIGKWFTIKDNTGTVYYIPAWT